MVTIGTCGRSSFGLNVLTAEGVLIKIGVVAGDGVGPEVTAEGLAVLAAVARLEGFDLRDSIPFDLGGERYLRTGEVLPDAERRASSAAAMPSCSAPSATPRCRPGVLEKGILLRLRFDFHQYINLRPVRLYPGVESPIKGKGPDDIDMVVVRENNEDLYVGAGGFTAQGDARGSRDPDLDQHPRRGRADASGSPSTWHAAAPRTGRFAACRAADRRPGLVSGRSRWSPRPTS